MGAFQSVFKGLFGKEEIRILMVGLDAAGKTTILYKLKLGEIVTTTPAAGFSVETVEYKNINFAVWDVGGQNSSRSLCRQYFTYAKGLIFVVDSNDREKMTETKDELNRILHEDELRDAAVLILANKQYFVRIILREQSKERRSGAVVAKYTILPIKNCSGPRLSGFCVTCDALSISPKLGPLGDCDMDLPNALNVGEVTDALVLHQIKDRNWFIQATCATSGEGLYEGLDWLASQIKKSM